FSGLDGPLIVVGRLLDFTLHESRFNGAEHSAQGVNLRDIGFRAALDFVGQGFDGVRAAERVHGVRDAAFARDNLLRAERHRRRAARNLATSSRKSLCAARKNDRRGAMSSTASPRAWAAST